MLGQSEQNRSAIIALAREIADEQQKWDKQYQLDGGPKFLQYHNQAHWNILYCYVHQLYLLLHRPFLRLTESDAEYSPESKASCVASEKAVLNIHKQFYETQYLKQYRWFTNDLGSCYALHGAVTLYAYLLKIPSGEESPRYCNAFDDAVLPFSELAQQSKICARALPVLQYLQ